MIAAGRGGGDFPPAGGLQGGGPGRQPFPAPLVVEMEAEGLPGAAGDRAVGGDRWAS